MRFTSPINAMAPAHRSTRAMVTETKQEPVAKQELIVQRRATKLMLVTKNAEEATVTIEEEQAVSDTNVSQSRKRRWVDDEPLAFADPRSLGIAVAQKSPNSKTGCAGREIQLAETESTQVHSNITK